MALVFDWLGIAEGSAADSRGALTLVGVGQNVIFATDFPHREQRVIVTTVVDESGEEVQENVQFDFEITVTSPSGRTLLGNRQVLTTGGATNPAAFAAGLPARGFQMVVGIGLEVMEYGIHPVSVSIGIPGAPTLLEYAIYTSLDPRFSVRFLCLVRRSWWRKNPLHLRSWLGRDGSPIGLRYELASHR